MSDVDAAVLTHPAAHHRVITERDELPFEDQFFDLIVCDYVFEHLERPRAIAGELIRVLRPGGVICARTANSWGYPALAATIIPDRLHRAVLSRAQPDRRDHDIFPTVYRLNRPRDVTRNFPGCEFDFYFDSAEPAYHFNSSTLARGLAFLHRHLPPDLATGFCCFIRKP